MESPVQDSLLDYAATEAGASKKPATTGIIKHATFLSWAENPRLVVGDSVGTYVPPPQKQGQNLGTPSCHVPAVSLPANSAVDKSRNSRLEFMESYLERTNYRTLFSNPARVTGDPSPHPVFHERLLFFQLCQAKPCRVDFHLPLRHEQKGFYLGRAEKEK